MAPPTVGSRTSRVAGVPLAATCFSTRPTSGAPSWVSQGSSGLPTTSPRPKPVTRFMARFHTVTRPSMSVAMIRALACSISCSR